MLSREDRVRLCDSVASSARTLRLSNSTAAWFLERATPGQLQAVDELFAHEIETREANKRARLMRQARFPAVKSVDPFDHSDLTFQGGYGWDDLLSLARLDRHQDFVSHGPTGRGKTHLMVAIGMLAVNAGRSVRFASAAQLVLELKRAQEAGRLGDRWRSTRGTT